MKIRSAVLNLLYADGLTGWHGEINRSVFATKHFQRTQMELELGQSLNYNKVTLKGA
jgi:hypothetical protein